LQLFQLQLWLLFIEQSKNIYSNLSKSNYY
jgi:hypothetical protein